MTGHDPYPTVLDAALAAHDAGLCVIRARVDGSKAPMGQWSQWQQARPTRTEVHTWFAAGHQGMGIVCGNVSGDLEMFELEGRFIDAGGAKRFKQAMAAAGLELVLQRLVGGFRVESPSGGRHFWYRCGGAVAGNLKLARNEQHETLIETRGEGGFVIAPPSCGTTHPSGHDWTLRAGTYGTIPTLTAEERDQLHDVARSFDQAPTAPAAPTRTATPSSTSAWTGGPVGDSWMDAVAAHLAATVDMRTLLERHGWTYCYTDSHGRHLLRRPGKDHGVSGSINPRGRFCPFTTSAPFEAGGGGPRSPTYDQLDVLATYEHGGDRQAAGRWHAEQTGILEQWQAEQRGKDGPAPTAGTDSRPDIDPDTGEILDAWHNLPNDFWEARDTLAMIREAAHSRIRSADAVLTIVLARLAATIPPQIRLPPIVGAAASLNLLAAVVADSGGGKSTAGDVAKELAPINRADVLDGVPPGSGEGLVEMFYEWIPEEQPDGKTRRVKRKTKSGAYVYLDEGQALGELGNRRGATLLPTLRTAWSGGLLGQQNAAEETRRRLEPHSYRLAMVVGFQAEHADTLLNDSAGGTPQRFVFASANDPTIPDQRPAWPGTIDTTPPTVTGEQHIDVADTVTNEIAARALAAARGGAVTNPLDSHADLVRLKVAALLGYLEGRLEVTAEDWELAGAVMRTSNAVRSWIAEIARQRAQAEEMRYHRRAADREVIVASTVESKALTSAARSVANRVWRDSAPVGRRDLNHAIAGKHRQIVSVDDALAEAERLHWITPNGDLGWARGKARPA